MTDSVDEAPALIGMRVRAERTSRGWTLDDLADRSGVSRRMIVNVEGGSTNASIATLLRIAHAFEVPLTTLVSDGDDGDPCTIVRRGQQRSLWHGENGGTATLVSSTVTPDVLELWEWILEPGDEHLSEAHRPGTQELLHVTRGQMVLTIDGAEHVLRAGDAARFDADVPHAYANVSRRSTRMSLTVFEPLARVRP